MTPADGKRGHTPGPWVVKERGDGTFNVLTDARFMGSAAGCSGFHLANVTLEANARLMAAAPDLLRELTHLARLLEPALNNGQAQIPGLATVNGAWLALAKCAP